MFTDDPQAVSHAVPGICPGLGDKWVGTAPSFSLVPHEVMSVVGRSAQACVDKKPSGSEEARTTGSMPGSHHWARAETISAVWIYYQVKNVLL